MSEELKSAKEIKGYDLGAEDGRIGECYDFLFDDTDWVIRYIVADTRKWLPGRKVLISPISIGVADTSSHTLQVSLTKEQIRDSPPLDTDAPVSRQYEILFNRYYAWSHYWDGDLAWGVHPYPRLLQQPNGELLEVGELPDEKNHLKSVNEVLGYRIHAIDTDIGHIDDFIVEQKTWIVRYLVIDTSNWLPGGKWVLLPTAWVTRIDWARSSIDLRLTADKLKNGPEYEPARLSDREYEKEVFDFYGLSYYWRG